MTGKDWLQVILPTNGMLTQPWRRECMIYGEEQRLEMVEKLPISLTGLEQVIGSSRDLYFLYVAGVLSMRHIFE